MVDVQITDANALIQKATQDIANYQTQIKNYEAQIAALKKAIPQTEDKICLKYTSNYLKNLLRVIFVLCALIFGLLFGLSSYRSRFIRVYQIYKLLFLFILAPMLFAGIIVNFWPDPINKTVGNAVVGIFSFLAVMFLVGGIYLGIFRDMKLVTFILLSFSFSFFGIVGIVKHKMDYFDA